MPSAKCRPFCPWLLRHCGRVAHICVGKLTIIGSDNGLSPDRRQAIIWTNVGILLIGPPGTNFNEMLIEIHTFSFKKIHLKMSSGKWRPFCLGLNVLRVAPCGPVEQKPGPAWTCSPTDQTNFSWQADGACHQGVRAIFRNELLTLSGIPIRTSLIS